MSRVLCLIAGLAALGWSGGPAAHAAPLSLESQPPGAWVSIRGPVSLSGTAPLPLGELPDGDYELTAEGPGLPRARGRFSRGAAGLASRPWASPAALLLPPGIVHLQRGEGRGWVFLTTGATAAGLAVLRQVELEDAEDDRARAEALYGGALSDEAIRSTRRELQIAAQKVEDEREMRNLWIGGLAASWAGAGVEALLCTPQPRLDATNPAQHVLDLPAAGRVKTALRSLIVPGAGQRAMGRDTRANFFTATTAVLGAGAIAAQGAFLEARRDQLAAQARFDDALMESELRLARRELGEAKERVSERSTLRWAFAGAAAGVYLWNVIDAFGIGNDLPLPDLSWSPSATDDGFRVSATWSVP